MRMQAHGRHNFISLQLDYWDSPWQNRHALLWELSNTQRVFFLSPPFYLVDLLRGRAYARTALHGLSEPKPDLYSYVPPRFLPYNYRFQGVDRVIGRWRHGMIRRQLDRLGFERPILYIWHPRFADMLGRFDEAMVIYHKYDNYAGYFDGKAGPNPREMRLLERADAVFVSSAGLFEMHRHDTSNLYFVPNGVDYDYFHGVVSQARTPPSDIAAIPGPRIGYVGVVNEKVDFDMLLTLCRARPDWSIVLVGPDRVTLPEFAEKRDRLRRQANCYFLGEKPGRQVPEYIAELDVCMMCYVVNNWTYFGYPLKMHEYLACGKPCVAADLPAIREFADVIEIAHSHDAWLQAIDRSLTSDTVEQQERRLAVAQNNSWAARVRTILDVVERKVGAGTIG